MKTLTQLVALSLALSLAWPCRAAAPGEVTPKTAQPAEAKALSRAFADTARALRPSVVRVDVEEGPAMGLARRNRSQGEQEMPELFERFFGEPDLRELPMRGTGSGVIFDAAGFIVTNRHVVANARKMTVILEDGRELSAKVVGKDPRTDVAVLKLDNPPSDLVAARLGNSDNCEVGEWVLAIGSPLGMDQTVTAGILSGKGRAGRRMQMSGDRVRRYLQTDAKINPGNSGGPLVDLDGQVIGINTLINAGPGGSYGFAIPINEVRTVADALIKDGKITYAYLGVMVGDIAALEADKREKLGKGTPDKGGLVSEVSEDGPAGKAGMKPGDVIVAVDEQKIQVGPDVVDYVSSRPVGSKVTVSLVREGKPKKVQVTLGELPAGEDEAEASAPEAIERAGLWVQSLTPELAAALGMDPRAKGAVVSEVIRGGASAKVGLQQGEVIVEVDRKPVTNGSEAAKALQVPKPHLLRVKTHRGSRFVTLPAK